MQENSKIYDKQQKERNPYLLIIVLILYSEDACSDDGENVYTGNLFEKLSSSVSLRVSVKLMDTKCKSHFELSVP